MAAFEGEKHNNQKSRPINKTATEKAYELANSTSSLSRPRISPKSLTAMGLGVATGTFIGPANVGAALVNTGPINFVGSNADWDVDGDGGADFRITAAGSAGSVSQIGIYSVAGQYFRIA